MIKLIIKALAYNWLNLLYTEWSYFNPFFLTVLFLYPLKISENFWFSDVFRGIEKEQWHEIG